MKEGWSSVMDRRVKERLVGATILVVLIVLIVPELLSGPKARVTPVQPPSAAGPAEAVRNVTVDLATSKTTPAEHPPPHNPPAPPPPPPHTPPPPSARASDAPAPPP